MYRELSTGADTLPNAAMDTQTSEVQGDSVIGPQKLQGWFNGGHRDNGLSAHGWRIQASFEENDVGNLAWVEVAHASVLLPPGTTHVEAELCWLEKVSLALLSISMCGTIILDGPSVKPLW